MPFENRNGGFDYQPRFDQARFDTDDNSVDPIANESGDDPTELLGVPDDEYGEELEKIAIDDPLSEAGEDARENIEDRTEAQ